MHISLPYHIERKTRLFVIIGAITMIAAFAIGAVFWKQERYDLLLYIDVPLHLFGGGSAALVFLIAIVRLHGEAHFKDVRYWLRAVLILGFTALVTIAWEFFEYFGDTYLGTDLQSTVIETLKDMAIGLVGATPVAFWIAHEPFDKIEESRR